MRPNQFHANYRVKMYIVTNTRPHSKQVSAHEMCNMTRKKPNFGQIPGHYKEDTQFQANSKHTKCTIASYLDTQFQANSEHMKCTIIASYLDTQFRANLGFGMCTKMTKGSESEQILGLRRRR